MRPLNRWSKDRTQTLPLARRRLAPVLEMVETRQLLTACATGFLTGSVYLDGSQNVPVPGTTIELFRPGNTCTPVSVQKTDANGQYLFTGLQPGDYLLKERPASGYAAASAQPASQLDPASAVGSDTIKVTVVDPTKVFVNYGGINAGSFSVVNDVVKGGAQVNSVGPMNDTLGTSAGATDLNGGYQTLCVNDQQSLSFGGGESYRVVPRPVSALTNGGATLSADHAGRIAYLFNHFGNSSLTNVRGAALQLAVWELLYDNGDRADFAAGGFQVSGLAQSVAGESLSDILAQAAAYYDGSAGHSETAVFLDAAAANPCAVKGLQSVLAVEALNFTVTPATHVCCQPSGVHYVIDGCKTVTTLAGNVRPGDTVEVDFTVPAGAAETLSLVSYNADCTFDLTRQTVACAQTATFGPGAHSLKVSVPRGYFQVDFVCGDVITRFDPGAGVTYHAENRFIDAARGGPSSCDTGGHGGSVCDTGGHGGSSRDHGGSVCDTGGRDESDCARGTRVRFDQGHGGSWCDSGVTANLGSWLGSIFQCGTRPVPTHTGSVCDTGRGGDGHGSFSLSCGLTRDQGGSSCRS